MSRGAFKLRDTDNHTYYQGYKDAVFHNLPIGIAYGIYIVVYIASVYVLQSKPGFTSSLYRMSLLGITTLTFALGVIVLVLNTTLEIQEANNSTTCNTCLHIWGVISFLMCSICDSICAWRTVIIWNYDKRVIAILVFFILGFTCISIYSILAPTAPLGHFYLLLSTGTTLVTNMLSTGLIAWKAWQRRIPVMDNLHKRSGSMIIGRVFALLIESGFIYCCIWILFTISMLCELPYVNFNLMVFVSGIYPTLIIILISKQMSPVEHYSTHSTHSNEMRYTGVPTHEPLRQ